MKFVVLAIFAIFVARSFTQEEKFLLVLRFLRNLWTSQSPSWPFLFLSVAFCEICYSCYFCHICCSIFSRSRKNSCYFCDFFKSVDILWNSEFQVLNSRFYLSETWTPDLNCQRNSGFQSPGFHISRQNFSDSGIQFTLHEATLRQHTVFTIITINLEILERSLVGTYFLKLYLDWKQGKIIFLRFLNKFHKTSAFVSWPIATSWKC